MFKKIFLLALFVVFGLMAQISLAQDINSPVGKWIQVDEKTHQKHSIIEIYSDQGKLFGKILETFPQNGKPPRKFCDLCKGELYNAPIIGLVIMQDFSQSKANVWDDGTILDPASGKIYNCKLTLLPGGKYLKVCGYIGISLLGRSQFWLRQPLAE
jgi:uncharacterized protein (DUF2147 family)